MKLKAKFDRKLKIRRLLAGSPTARSIAANQAQIEKALSANPRLVWPLATVARLFGITPSLLRKWVEQGFLARFQRPTARHRSGLPEQVVRGFLGELADEAAFVFAQDHHRPRPAEEKCRQAMRELKPGEALAPGEFAARAGVAVTTVHRLLAEGCLDAWHPTPHRPRICNWAEKELRKRLTRKAAKKAR